MIHDEFRKTTIKNESKELEGLAKPNITLRSDLDKQVQNKLFERKMVFYKYGKLPLKPGFKRDLNFKDKMALINMEIYGTQLR